MTQESVPEGSEEEENGDAEIDRDGGPDQSLSSNYSSSKASSQAPSSEGGLRLPAFLEAMEKDRDDDINDSVTQDLESGTTMSADNETSTTRTSEDEDGGSESAAAAEEVDLLSQSKGSSDALDGSSSEDEEDVANVIIFRSEQSEDLEKDNCEIAGTETVEFDGQHSSPNQNNVQETDLEANFIEGEDDGVLNREGRKSNEVAPDEQVFEGEKDIAHRDGDQQ